MKHVLWLTHVLRVVACACRAPGSRCQAADAPDEPAGAVQHGMGAGGVGPLGQGHMAGVLQLHCQHSW